MNTVTFHTWVTTHAPILATKERSVKMYGMLMHREEKSGEVALLRQSGREGERGE
jgi:hypothetical protein